LDCCAGITAVEFTNAIGKRQMCSVYVIGSGPSGIYAAMALMTKGIPVTMLDAGLELEKGHA
jgi:cation diffusion facilitator CzcD-associated flavoprotein CzcO